MLGHKNKGAYTDDFAYEPTTTRERTIAASVAIAWSLALAILAGLAHDTAPKLAGFIPAVEAVVLTATLFTAWMLFSQYRIKHHAPLAILACAYGLFGVLHGWYLAAFPGVFDTVGFAGTNSQSAVWLTEFARLGFAATVGVFVFVERSKRRSARWHAGIVARTSAAVLGYLLAAAFAVTAGSRWLPVLLLPSGTFSFFDTHVIAPFMLVAMFAAAAGIVVICGVQRRVHLWLSVVLLSMGLEVLASTLFGGKRFSFGWYVGHIDSALSSLLFFCVMQGQLAAILRRAARNSERALALHDMVSLGADTSLDRNTVMLERAALDLNFEWACLAQIDRGLVTLESSLGDSPYPCGLPCARGRTLAQRRAEASRPSHHRGR